MDLLEKLVSFLIFLQMLIIIPAPVWVGIIVVLPFVITVVAVLVGLARH